MPLAFETGGTYGADGAFPRGKSKKGIKGGRALQGKKGEHKERRE